MPYADPIQAREYRKRYRAEHLEQLKAKDRKYNAENKDKIEIWFTPRFLVEREIDESTSHFKDIFPDKWPDKAAMGIIWTLGDVDLRWYDYSTSLRMDQVSHNNFDAL